MWVSKHIFYISNFLINISFISLRWAAIAARLPGRTDNEIKNVWHTHLKKRVNQNEILKDQTKQNKNDDNHFHDQLSCSSEIKLDGEEDIDRCIKNNNDDKDAELAELAFAEDFLKSLLLEEEFSENDWNNLGKDCVMIKDVVDESPKEVEIPLSGEEEMSNCSSSDTVDIMDFWRNVFMKDGELQEINI